MERYTVYGNWNDDADYNIEDFEMFNTDILSAAEEECRIGNQPGVRYAYIKDNETGERLD